MEPVAQVDQGNVTNLHSDHLYTPRLGTDSTQATVWQWESPAFGNAEPQLEGVVVNLRFPGQYYDSETGLHYNWNRYYDPTIGRYVTSDPIGLNGGANTYGYVGGNPLMDYDPMGLMDQSSKEHLERNRLNKCPSEQPKVNGYFTAIDCKGNTWQLDRVGAITYHGFFQEGNFSFRRADPNSKKGGFQCVYSIKGKLVTQGKYRGTYDYHAPKKFGDTKEHRRLDVIPHDKNNNYSDPDLTQVIESNSCSPDDYDY